jgi:hypothetical protein
MPTTDAAEKYVIARLLLYGPRSRAELGMLPLAETLVRARVMRGVVAGRVLFCDALPPPDRTDYAVGSQLELPPPLTEMTRLHNQPSPGGRSDSSISPTGKMRNQTTSATFSRSPVADEEEEEQLPFALQPPRIEVATCALLDRYAISTQSAMARSDSCLRCSSGTPPPSRKSPSSSNSSADRLHTYPNRTLCARGRRAARVAYLPVPHFDGRSGERERRVGAVPAAARLVHLQHAERALARGGLGSPGVWRLFRACRSACRT